MDIARRIALPTDRAAVIALQRQLAPAVDLTPDNMPKRLIAAADVSYLANPERAYAAVVVVDARTLAEIDRATWIGEPPYPYRSGLFVLREAACLLEAFKALRTVPDAILIDGHGTAHPRRFGLACYIGLSLEAPTIGCAKTRLYGAYGEVGAERGAYADLTASDGAVIGRVLRTRAGAKPVFVSPGHRYDVDSAAALVLSLSPKFRIPEPLRQAHNLTAALRAGA